MQKRFGFFGVIVLLISVLGACAPKTVYIVNEGGIFGTTYRFVYQHPDDQHKALNELLWRFNSSLSTFDSNSYISRLNRNEAGLPSDTFFLKMFAMAQEVTEKSSGAFDITVAPLVNAWGFGFKNRETITEQLIDSLRQYVGMDQLRIEDGCLIKKQAGVMLDGSAIAKGYGVDVAAEYLESLGVKNYLLEIGGEMRSLGLNAKGSIWRVGIDKPDFDQFNGTRELQMIINLSGASLATSGNYRNYYMEDGKRFAHIIDPRSGYPVNHSLLSASVIAPTCMEADAYATACMVLGLDSAKLLVESLPGIEACFIYHGEEEYQVYCSPGFPLDEESGN